MEQERNAGSRGDGFGEIGGNNGRLEDDGFGRQSRESGVGSRFEHSFQSDRMGRREDSRYGQDDPVEQFVEDNDNNETEHNHNLRGNDFVPTFRAKETVKNLLEEKKIEENPLGSLRNSQADNPFPITDWNEQESEPPAPQKENRKRSFRIRVDSSKNSFSRGSNSRPATTEQEFMDLKKTDEKERVTKELTPNIVMHGKNKEEILKNFDFGESEIDFVKKDSQDSMFEESGNSYNKFDKKCSKTFQRDDYDYGKNKGENSGENLKAKTVENFSVRNRKMINRFDEFFKKMDIGQMNTANHEPKTENRFSGSFKANSENEGNFEHKGNSDISQEMSLNQSGYNEDENIGEEERGTEFGNVGRQEASVERTDRYMNSIGYSGVDDEDFELSVGTKEITALFKNKLFMKKDMKSTRYGGESLGGNDFEDSVF